MLEMFTVVCDKRVCASLFQCARVIVYGLRLDSVWGDGVTRTAVGGCNSSRKWNLFFSFALMSSGDVNPVKDDGMTRTTIATSKLAEDTNF